MQIYLFTQIYYTNQPADVDIKGKHSGLGSSMIW